MYFLELIHFNAAITFIVALQYNVRSGLYKTSPEDAMFLYALVSSAYPFGIFRQSLHKRNLFECNLFVWSWFYVRVVLNILSNIDFV